MSQQPTSMSRPLPGDQATAFPVDREPANARPVGFNQPRAAGYASRPASARCPTNPSAAPSILNLT